MQDRLLYDIMPFSHTPRRIIIIIIIITIIIIPFKHADLDMVSHSHVL